MTGHVTQGVERDLGGHFQILDTRFLVAIHHGQIDIVQLARQELVNRGLDGDGHWVGFAKAEEALGM